MNSNKKSFGAHVIDLILRSLPRVAGEAHKLEILGVVRSSRRQRYDVVDGAGAAKLRTAHWHRAPILLKLPDPLDIAWCEFPLCMHLTGAPTVLSGKAPTQVSAIPARAKRKSAPPIVGVGSPALLFLLTQPCSVLLPEALFISGHLRFVFRPVDACHALKIRHVPLCDVASGARPARAVARASRRFRFMATDYKHHENKNISGRFRLQLELTGQRMDRNRTTSKTEKKCRDCNG